jgi:hypothetical protein
VGASVVAPPGVALAFGLLDFGERVEEGQVVRAITPVWMRIITDLETPPVPIICETTSRGRLV